MKGIKAILIDIDNTLLDFYESAKYAVGVAFGKVGLDYNEHCFKVFTEQNDLLWQKIECGELTRQGLHQIRFKIIFDVLNLNGNDLKAEEEFRKALFNVAVAVDGAKDLVEHLAKKYKLYCASNAIYNQQINRLKLAGMHDNFEDFFISERIGYQKPTKEFFDYCFSQMGGICPSETIMIGDSLTADITGAKKYGIKSIWYNHLKKENDSDIFPDFSVDSLSQIKKIL